MFKKYYFIFLLLEIQARIPAFGPSHNIDIETCKSGLDRATLTTSPLLGKPHMIPKLVNVN